MQWYLSFPVVYRVDCNENLLLGLLKEEFEIEDAERISCRPVEAIGRPSGYTFLINILIGSSGAVFGFYVNSGNPRKEKGDGTI